MRVSTLVIIVVLLIALVGGGIYLFGGIDGFMQWKDGFGPATTPEQAMEKFRDAIQKRKYRWAANYCTKDYAEILVKTDGPAARIGDTIDKIRDYMINNKLQTDQSLLLLYRVDPFPTNFKVQGAVKQVNDNEATGVFAWEPLAGLSANASLNPTALSGLDDKMFRNNLTPALAVSAIKIVKEGEQWKLSIDTPPGLLETSRYFVDRSPAYESELKTFRTYMMNGRYDSGKVFEAEVVDTLKKANGGR